MLTEIIPTTESSFRTLTDRENRAIAGLSMGAGKAVSVILTAPLKPVGHELVASTSTVTPPPETATAEAVSEDAKMPLEQLRRTAAPWQHQSARKAVVGPGGTR